MQESFDVFASGSNYRVIVGRCLLDKLIARHSDAIFLVDEYLAPDLPVPNSRMISVKATESNKSLECMSEMILKLRELGANRSSHLVAVGGGVIQDIATLSASIYMRGIHWTYMPTTLLGMADSCIGGKSSINVQGYKNLVGNIYPPTEVIIDVDFVATLDAEQIVGGLFEAAKICYARGCQEFQSYLSERVSKEIFVDNVHPLIVRSLRAKKWFIETDEFDKKERLLLNFGHTFGHAIEAGTNFGVSHGIAVGLGMMVAVEYAGKKNWLSQTGIDLTASLTKHVKSMLGKGSDCIVTPPAAIDLKLINEKFNNDKKHLSEFYRLVCPLRDGELELVTVTRSDDVRSDILLAYVSVFKEIGWCVA